MYISCDMLHVEVHTWHCLCLGNVHYILCMGLPFCRLILGMCFHWTPLCHWIVFSRLWWVLPTSIWDDRQGTQIMYVDYVLDTCRYIISLDVNKIHCACVCVCVCACVRVSHFQELIVNDLFYYECCANLGIQWFHIICIINHSVCIINYQPSINH